MGKTAKKKATKKKSAPDSYAAELRRLQIQLVCLQRHLIAHNEKLLVIIEGRDGAGKDGTRSEEHTSELQSLMRISYAVFCLKKKKNNQTHKHQPTHIR